MLGIIGKKVGVGGYHVPSIQLAVSALRHYSSAAKEMTVRDALNSALDEEMSAVPRVFLMGEEVGEYQGAYKISKGLLEKYGPERVLDTPITECYAAWYGSCPGLKVLVPYSSEDAHGLLKAAIREPDPVVFLENGLLYGQSFPISAEVLDSRFCLPIGKAKIINLRSIRPLDMDTINASVWKTNRLVTAEEGYPQHGVGAEICASVTEESFFYLDAPVEGIAGADVPMPHAANLERTAVPQVEDIVRAAKRAC